MAGGTQGRGVKRWGGIGAVPSAGRAPSAGAVAVSSRSSSAGSPVAHSRAPTSGTARLRYLLTEMGEIILTETGEGILLELQ